MVLQALPLPQPPGGLCVAPTGYGKTEQLKHWQSLLDAQQQPYIKVSAADVRVPEAIPYFTSVWQQLNRKDLSLASVSPLDRHGLYQYLLQHPTKRWWLQDDWEHFAQNPEILSFWQDLLDHRPEGFACLLICEAPPESTLDTSQFMAEGGTYYGIKDLRWRLETAQQFNAERGKAWSTEAQARHQNSEGWPLASILGEAENPGLIRRLKMRQRTSYYWTRSPSPLWQRLQGQAFKNNAQYSLRQAMSTQDLTQRRAHLYRSAGLDDTASHQVKVLTLLAHQYLQAGQWQDCDRMLNQAEPLIQSLGAAEAGSNTLIAPIDQAAWLYLKANRERQCCQYASAHQHLDQLQMLSGAEVVKFHTRAVQLRGLTYYQQGQYHKTKTLYQQALALALHDGNKAMELEIHSMLYFLDALQEGGPSENTPVPEIEDLLTQVKALPFTRQPLIYLNLVFAQLLGERIDVPLAQTLLNQAKHIAETLNWDSLWPLIWDVEARLWRFLKRDDHAAHLHQQALQRLEPQSFAFLYAYLNQTLTALRQPGNAQAYQQLEDILEQARSHGSEGLVREAEALLPHPSTQPTKTRIQTPASTQTGTLLRIQTFGEFQVYLNEKPVARWPRKKSRHILIQLLLHSHSMHRETLADWLTANDDLEQALRSLDVHIHALRKVLEPHRKGKQASQFIHFQDACYRFNRQSHYQWDAEDFSTGYDYWLKHKTEPTSLPQVENTLQLYQGVFLPELDFADLWQAEREHYQRQGRELSLWCARTLQSQGEPEQARAHLTRWLQWDPTCEAVFVQLFEQALQEGDLRQLESWGEQMEQTFIDAGELIPGTLKQVYQSVYQNLS
jgi:DNA-binding SARP family transcriptional activator